MLAGALLAPFVGESTIFAGPFDALVGACAGAGLIAIVGWLGEAALGREAMGMGDMTLMAFVGATIGAVAFLAIVYPIAMLRRGRSRSSTQTELALDAAPDKLQLPLVRRERRDDAEPSSAGEVGGRLLAKETEEV